MSSPAPDLHGGLTPRRSPAELDNERGQVQRLSPPGRHPAKPCHPLIVAHFLTATCCWSKWAREGAAPCTRRWTGGPTSQSRSSSSPPAPRLENGSYGTGCPA